MSTQPLEQRVASGTKQHFAVHRERGQTIKFKRHLSLVGVKAERVVASDSWPSQAWTVRTSIPPGASEWQQYPGSDGDASRWGFSSLRGV